MAANSTFHVRVIDGDTTQPVLVLAGELDIAGVAELEAVFETVEALPAEVIRVDLSDLSFLDSAGLEALLAADGRGRDLGRHVVIIAGENRSVRRVFELTGMGHYLNVEAGVRGDGGMAAEHDGSYRGRRKAGNGSDARAPAEG